MPAQPPPQHPGPLWQAAAYGEGGMMMTRQDNESASQIQKSVIDISWATGKFFSYSFDFYFTNKAF